MCNTRIVKRQPVNNRQRIRYTPGTYRHTSSPLDVEHGHDPCSVFGRQGRRHGHCLPQPFAPAPSGRRRARANERVSVGSLPWPFPAGSTAGDRCLTQRVPHACQSVERVAGHATHRERGHQGRRAAGGSGCHRRQRCRSCSGGLGTSSALCGRPTQPAVAKAKGRAKVFE
jgi:hypothetical protein